MRDLFLTLFIFGYMPWIIIRPHYGIFMWSWLTYMTPHRLTWSFAFDFRFNYFVTIITLYAILKSKEYKIRVPLNFATFFWIFFSFWVTLSGIDAIEQGAAWAEWTRYMKIQIMVIVTYTLIKKKEHLIFLVGVIAFSIGFFAFKGGIFTLLKGGHFRVLGPEFSFIADNNTFALAINMTIPLMFYFLETTKNKLYRLLIMFHIFLCILAVFGSYSRGGLIGLLAIAIALWLSSSRKIILLIFIIILIPTSEMIMPEKWTQRISPMLDSLNIPHTIPENWLLSPRRLLENNEFLSNTIMDSNIEKFETNQGLIKEDAEILRDLSIKGRFDAWNMAKLMSKDRPFFGGGFGSFSQESFDRYTPGVFRHAAHSIYFQVLGEQGYAGLIIWSLMHVATIFTGLWVVIRCKKDPDLKWASIMARNIIIGMLGYYTSGLSLGLAYYDLPYHYSAILVILKLMAKQKFLQRKNNSQAQESNIGTRANHIFPFTPPKPTQQPHNPLQSPSG
ncbi:MAG: putative O-glycosylation ligase, exosortase A system-associated [Magnetococcales bacterium]|nr:putative O-glycosylation ligase, exosortase A system-associated [Magnetococcales bacterium]